MKKGYVKAKNIEKLYNWINGTALNQIDKKDITVSLCDEAGEPVVTLDCAQCLPYQTRSPFIQCNDQ